MNELQLIQSKIHEIRGQKVMLDRDLAELYGVETSQLKRAVRRNIGRFAGDDFMFELTKDDVLRCQFGTLDTGRGQHFKYMPFAFTELGVAMLSSVLRSETAIEINRGIMRAFVAVRQMLSEDSSMKRLSVLEKNFEELKQDLEDIFADYNDINEDTRAQLEAINTTLAELQSRPPITPRRPVGFIKPDSR
ncbi:MAG: ORF6N domain-containing protein [Bacteroides sp.]|nr:ORF6N domain-containing protein [Bacteroides sp.]MCM1389004.1 ORF6N domain-containing protein [Bacteroides sp.]